MGCNVIVFLGFHVFVLSGSPLGLRMWYLDGEKSHRRIDGMLRECDTDDVKRNA